MSSATRAHAACGRAPVAFTRAALLACSRCDRNMNQAQIACTRRFVCASVCAGARLRRGNRLTSCVVTRAHGSHRSRPRQPSTARPVPGIRDIQGRAIRARAAARIVQRIARPLVFTHAYGPTHSRAKRPVRLLGLRLPMRRRQGAFTHPRVKMCPSSRSAQEDCCQRALDAVHAAIVGRGFLRAAMHDDDPIHTASLLTRSLRT